MKKILVVDDDLDILSLVEMTLTMNKYAVKSISRWQEIFDAITEFAPHLILLDVSLNGADGTEICKQIKQTAAILHIPVVIFSANAEMANYVGECQAQAFLAKPFTLSGLLQTIEAHS
jgi:DNA-binding response OmpR family regulator